jgi:hypothetical protein
MPAPAPTELLADDIRRLEESNQRIVGRIDSLEKAVEGMGKVFAGFRARVNTILAITSAIALIVLGSATMVWNGAASLQRELGRTEGAISSLEKRFEENRSLDEKRFEAGISNLNKQFEDMRTELRSFGEKLNRIGEDVARLQGRLDRDRPTPKSP